MASQSKARSLTMARGRLRGFRPERLRAAREASGLTQELLAIHAGISRSSIGSWEAGRAAPDPRSAVQVADTLGLKVQQLTDIAIEDAEPADFRIWKGLTRLMVEQACGVSEQSLGQVERFSSRPGPDTVQRLAHLFGVERDVYVAAWERGHARVIAPRGGIR